MRLKKRTRSRNSSRRRAGKQPWWPATNAAHQATFKDIGDISDEEWEKTFRTNIHSMFYLTKAAVPHLKPSSAIMNRHA
jgi:NAD(P)-dependent dehydrogenase (short-subunit alcohol dehydrogenase family)